MTNSIKQFLFVEYYIVQNFPKKTVNIGNSNVLFLFQIDYFYKKDQFSGPETKNMHQTSVKNDLRPGGCKHHYNFQLPFLSLLYHKLC